MVHALQEGALYELKITKFFYLRVIVDVVVMLVATMFLVIACLQATDKLPTSADLSNCHLEFMPDNIFVNDQLTILNLRHNVLRERPSEAALFPITIGWLDDLAR